MRYMPYPTIPHISQVRMDAVKLFRKGWSMRKVARHMGFNVSTISRWVRKAPDDTRRIIPTMSCRPHHHPHALPQATVDLICELRLRRKRCSEFIHYELTQMGVEVSLSSVKRVLHRAGLLKEKSKWKKYRHNEPRPDVASPGDLVELDTIHIVPFISKKRFYIYTLLDVCTRWAFAWVSPKLSAGTSVHFLHRAQEQAPFDFTMIQSDNGPEFSSWFTGHAGIQHRHSRVRKPNDNAHLERFNRTIQEECLYYLKQEPETYQKAIKLWLPYYNDDRPHLGLDFLTPSQVLQRS